MCGEFIQKEYFELVKIVGEFDRNFLIVKGWGVTFSLATLALAFRDKSRGLFVVAALSAFSFWIVEGELKGHQMRYYPRMRQIEVSCHTPDLRTQGPSIDWTWSHADTMLNSGNQSLFQLKPSLTERTAWYRMRWFLPHVMFPHVITVLLGLLFGTGFWRRIANTH